MGLSADERVTAFIGDGQPWSRECAIQRVNQAIDSNEISWFIVWRDGVRIGLFTATEIGYWLAPAMWGQGLAKVIVNQGLQHLQESGITDLMARVAPENIASLKVLERHGFIRQSHDAALVTLTRATPQA
ncbi:hypothetical protein AQ436_11975 [Arthrobacter sp. EpRS66]|nr:hypothetical protein AQ436_11975 [Arthrobacter sp. EpRS66]